MEGLVGRRGRIKERVGFLLVIGRVLVRRRGLVRGCEEFLGRGLNLKRGLRGE